MEWSSIFTVLTGGAFLGVLGTLGVSLLNQTHEKKKWVREQRLALYLEMLDVNSKFKDSFYSAMACTIEIHTPEDELDFDISESYAQLEISGPRSKLHYRKLSDFRTKASILSSKRSAKLFDTYCTLSSRAITAVETRKQGEPFDSSIGEMESTWGNWEKSAKNDLGIRD